MDENTRLLYHMLKIRLFEEKVDELMGKGRILGTMHLCIGQEAVAAGACAALEKTDFITSNHRGHGHFIAKGGDINKIMAELMGRSTGCSKGRGGTQHMADLSIGNAGSGGITGGMVPVATGIAFGIKYEGKGSVVVCFLGDGATYQGVFHESLNIASIWRLPIVYVCENNLYAMSSPFEKFSATASVANYASAYRMPGASGDGNDVLGVKSAVSEAVERARRGEGPSLLEFITYRHLGHSKSDPRVYRPKEEEKSWKKKDPIERLKRFLLQGGDITEAGIADITAKVDDEINAAYEFASASPMPDCLGADGVFAL